MIKNQFFIAAALLAGACIGFCLAPREENKEKKGAAVQEKTSQKVDAIADKWEQASIDALRKRIKSLEEDLALERGKNATEGFDKKKGTEK
ncbi:MAG: hypothetical protein KIH06_01200 [Kiritimatiellae bacterium]|nr:hypothetical protein [Kiritimatiellia bacterium]